MYSKQIVFELVIGASPDLSGVKTRGALDISGVYIIFFAKWRSNG
jgi:hypothetical protein